MQHVKLSVELMVVEMILFALLLLTLTLVQHQLISFSFLNDLFFLHFYKRRSRNFKDDL